MDYIDWCPWCKMLVDVVRRAQCALLPVVANQWGDIMAPITKQDDVVMATNSHAYDFRTSLIPAHGSDIRTSLRGEVEVVRRDGQSLPRCRSCSHVDRICPKYGDSKPGSNMLRKLSYSQHKVLKRLSTEARFLFKVRTLICCVYLRDLIIKGFHVSGKLREMDFFSGKSGKSQGSCWAPQANLQNAKISGIIFAGNGKFEW